MADEPRDPNTWRRATQLVRGGTTRSGFSETSEGLFMTSGYVYDSALEAEQSFTGERKRFVYSRFANPTVAMFEQRMALLEGTEFCNGTASGMAAVFAALLARLQAGDRGVASRAMFGACLFIVNELLPRYGIETELVDPTDLDQWEKALAKPTNVVFLETPSNPNVQVIDIQAVSDLAHAAGASVYIDNVFATPVLQRPMELGADVVIYSATKHIDGQGRAMGGAILTNDGEFVEERLVPFLRNTGPSLSPFNAWVLVKGLETLEMRVRQHCANARQVASFLMERKGVHDVLYPGHPSHPQYELASAQMDDGGTIIAFNVDGGKDAAFAFLDWLELIDISNNLGDAKSLITHPATTTHQRLTDEERAKMGITPGMVRLSVGLEDSQDIIEDIDQALGG